MERCLVHVWRSWGPARRLTAKNQKIWLFSRIVCVVVLYLGVAVAFPNLEKPTAHVLRPPASKTPKEMIPDPDFPEHRHQGVSDGREFAAVVVIHPSERPFADDHLGC